jgi:hypothetical protein
MISGFASPGGDPRTEKLLQINSNQLLFSPEVQNATWTIQNANLSKNNFTTIRNAKKSKVRCGQIELFQI